MPKSWPLPFGPWSIVALPFARNFWARQGQSNELLFGLYKQFTFTIFNKIQSHCAHIKRGG